MATICGGCKPRDRRMQRDEPFSRALEIERQTFETTHRERWVGSREIDRIPKFTDVLGIDVLE
jgi:hypothetical protein